MIRSIFTTTGWLVKASKNQIRLVIFEFGDIGHGIGSFSHTQYYASEGQLKVNNNGLMCQMSMKLPAMLEQNSPLNFDKEVEKQQKCSQNLTLSPKVKVIAEINRQ